LVGLQSSKKEVQIELESEVYNIEFEIEIYEKPREYDDEMADEYQSIVQKQRENETDTDDTVFASDFSTASEETQQILKNQIYIQS
jgi:hypothetical protein